MRCFCVGTDAKPAHLDANGTPIRVERSNDSLNEYICEIVYTSEGILRRVSNRSAGSKPVNQNGKCLCEQSGPLELRRRCPGPPAVARPPSTMVRILPSGFTVVVGKRPPSKAVVTWVVPVVPVWVVVVD